MNSMPKYAVSSTLREATWNNTTILSGNFAEEVGKLREEVDGSIWSPAAPNSSRA